MVVVGIVVVVVDVKVVVFMIENPVVVDVKVVVFVIENPVVVDIVDVDATQT